MLKDLNMLKKAKFRLMENAKFLSRFDAHNLMLLSKSSFLPMLSPPFSIYNPSLFSFELCNPDKERLQDLNPELQYSPTSKTNKTKSERLEQMSGHGEVQLQAKF